MDRVRFNSINTYTNIGATMKREMDGMENRLTDEQLRVFVEFIKATSDKGVGVK